MSGSLYRAAPPAAEPVPAAVQPAVLCVQMHAQNEAFLRSAIPGRVSMLGNASGALTSINKSAFDAYVLDYWLPDWTGIGLCREIRKSDPHVPILFYSSAESPYERRALRAGAHAYITAPAAPEAVGGCVQTLLARAEIQNLRARFAAEKAVSDEIERHVAAFVRSGRLPQDAAATIHRATRPRAARVFLDGGGTRAGFERFWQYEFPHACRRYGIPDDSAAANVPASIQNALPGASG